MFWKIAAVVSFVAGMLVGALFLRPGSDAPSQPAARPPTTTTTICPPAGGGQVDTSLT